MTIFSFTSHVDQRLIVDHYLGRILVQILYVSKSEHFRLSKRSTMSIGTMGIIGFTVPQGHMESSKSTGFTRSTGYMNASSKIWVKKVTVNLDSSSSAYPKNEKMNLGFFGIFCREE